MTAPDQTPTAPVVEPIAETQALEAEAQREAALPDWAREKLAKVNNEAKNLRQRLHDAEPLVAEANAAREAQKTEAQKATERAEQLQRDLDAARVDADRNRLATKHGVTEDYLQFIVGETAEERAVSAERIGALLKAQTAAAAPGAPVQPGPPMRKPVEALQSGASPTPPSPPPTDYPPEWTPHLKKRKE